MAAITYDLDIDTSDILTDPMSFGIRCADKAREMREEVKGGMNVSSRTADAKEGAKKTKAPDFIIDGLNALYSGLEESSPEEVLATIEAVERFRDDLHDMLRDKIGREVAMSSLSTLDKKVIVEQYKALRDMYANFVSTISILDKNLAKRLPTIPAMPGNFGSKSSTPVHLFVFDNEPGEEYWSPFSVIRKLELTETLHSMMDLLEYIEANPECGVTAHERVL